MIFSWIKQFLMTTGLFALALVAQAAHAFLN